MKSALLALLLVVGITLIASSCAASPADSNPSSLLGSPFEDQAAGISLRIPAGCHRRDRPVSAMTSASSETKNGSGSLRSLELRVLGRHF